MQDSLMLDFELFRQKFLVSKENTFICPLTIAST